MPHIFRGARDLAEQVQQAFEDLDRVRGSSPISGECSPAVDVFETASTIEIVVDLPGLRSDSVRVVINAGTVLVVGEKLPPAGPTGAARFHLVERGFGRFARALRLTGAFDASRADATLRGGELRLVVPKIEERRGRDIAVPMRYVGPST